MDGGDCNIPDAFLKKCGDNNAVCAYKSMCTYTVDNIKVEHLNEVNSLSLISTGSL